jgi:hypothetical protein
MLISLCKSRNVTSDLTKAFSPNNSVDRMEQLQGQLVQQLEQLGRALEPAVNRFNSALALRRTAAGSMDRRADGASPPSVTSGGRGRLRSLELSARLLSEVAKQGVVRLSAHDANVGRLHCPMERTP